VERLTAEEHASARDGNQAGQRVQKARLTRPIGAQEGDDFALADVQRDRTYGGDRPVAHHQFLHDKEIVQALTPLRLMAGLRQSIMARECIEA
jgi:hypothetical protein